MSTNTIEKPDGRATNALKHGKRMRSEPRNGMTIGSLGKGNGHIVVSLRQLRAALEAAVVAIYGFVSLVHSALINSACRHERTAQLATKWLRESGSSLEVNERLNLVKSIGAASDNRDRCLEKLKLDASPTDAWTVLHNAPVARTRDAAAENTENTTETTATHEASE